MPPLILLAVITGLPLLLAIILRVKPLYLFVSIVTGYFWVQFLGDPAELILQSFLHANHAGIMIRLVLLLLPVLLTFFLMRKTLSTNALPFQFFLLVGESVLLATFLLPILTQGTQQAVYQTHAGSVFHQAHDVIIAAVAGLHLLVMFVMRPKPNDEHHGKRH